MKTIAEFPARVLQFLADIVIEIFQTKTNDNPMEPVTPPNTPAPAPAPLISPPTVQTFCNEIQAMEGWYPGSTSEIHHSPGNIRCTAGDENNWNRLAIGSENDFCVFPSDTVGMEALVSNITSVCEGLSANYNAAARIMGLANCGEMNFYQFFQTRDPASDGNTPEALAVRFGTKFGVNPASFTMIQLLG